MLVAQWVLCSSEFLFSSMFAGRFSYFAYNFQVTACAVGLLFYHGLPEVHRKINFPNMLASVCTA